MSIACCRNEQQQRSVPARRTIPAGRETAALLLTVSCRQAKLEGVWIFENGGTRVSPAHLLEKLDKSLMQADLPILLQEAQKHQQGTAVKHIVRWERRI